MKQTAYLSSGAPAPIGPYSQAVKAGSLLFVSGQLGADAQTGKLADGVTNQTALALENLTAILQSAGQSLEQVVKTTVFLADMDSFASMNEVYSGFFKGQTPPARSCVAVRQLPKGALVEIEAVAICG